MDKIALVQVVQPKPVKPDDIGIFNISVDDLLSNGLNIIYFFLGAIAVIMIIIAGITMTTSGGDAEAVKKAKNTILYSVIGLIVVLMAFTITQFVIKNFK